MDNGNLPAERRRNYLTRSPAITAIATALGVGAVALMSRPITIGDVSIDIRGPLVVFAVGAQYTMQIASVGDLTVPVELTRTDGGTGSVLVSSGIPLPQGAYTATRGDISSDVKLVIGGTPQTIYAEALYGRYPDGSLRSVLIQTTQTVNSGSPVSGTVTFGVANTATTSKTAVTWWWPEAMFNMDSSYLVTTDLVGPTITRAATTSGMWTQWNDTSEYTMDTSWAADSTVLGASAEYQYDRAAALYSWWVRTGEWDWADHGMKFTEWSFHNYWASNSFQIPPRYHYPKGLAIHYWLTGQDSSRTAITEMTNYSTSLFTVAAYSADPEFYDYGEARIQANMASADLWAGLITDDSSTYWTASGKLDARIGVMLTAQTDSGAMSYQVDPAENLGVAHQGQVHWMEGLRGSMLIDYVEIRDPATARVDSIVNYVEGIWGYVFGQDPPFNSSTWLIDYSTTNGDNEETGESPDLNSLYVNSIAWLYTKTDSAIWLTRADSLFRKGVEDGFWEGNKQSNELQYDVANYLYWRTNPE